MVQLELQNPLLIPNIFNYDVLRRQFKTQGCIKLPPPSPGGIESSSWGRKSSGEEREEGKGKKEKGMRGEGKAREKEGHGKGKGK